jgi:hypothetical protein
MTEKPYKLEPALPKEADVGFCEGLFQGLWHECAKPNIKAAMKEWKEARRQDVIPVNISRFAAAFDSSPDVY